jgi:hypothetical protein
MHVWIQYHSSISPHSTDSISTFFYAYPKSKFGSVPFNEHQHTFLSSYSTGHCEMHSRFQEPPEGPHQQLQIIQLICALTAPDLTQICSALLILYRMGPPPRITTSAKSRRSIYLLPQPGSQHRFTAVKAYVSLFRSKMLGQQDDN